MASITVSAHLWLPIHATDYYEDRKRFGRSYSVLCENPACPAQWRVCEGEFTKRTHVAE